MAINSGIEQVSGSIVESCSIYTVCQRKRINVARPPFPGTYDRTAASVAGKQLTRSPSQRSENSWIFRMELNVRTRNRIHHSFSRRRTFHDLHGIFTSSRIIEIPRPSVFSRLIYTIYLPRTSPNYTFQLHTGKKGLPGMEASFILYFTTRKSLIFDSRDPFI